MNSIDRLPNEIIQLIINYASENHKEFLIVCAMISNRWSNLTQRFPIKRLVDSFAFYGHNSLIGWSKEILDNRTTFMAAKEGQLQTLIYLLDRKCPCLPNVILVAAQSGHVNILSWFETNGTVINYSKILYHGAIKGHLEVVKWALRGGAKFGDKLLMVVSNKGYTEIIQHLDSLRLLNYDLILGNACSGGQLDLARWVIDKGINPNNDHVNCAVESGNLELLKYFKDIGVLLYPSLTSIAAQQGFTEILSWLKNNGCEWSSKLCRDAADGGHLETLQWLVKNGCPLRKDAANYAASSGRVHILRWILEQKGPIDKNIIRYVFSDNVNADIIKWIYENGYGDNNINDYLEDFEKLGLINWAIQNGLSYDGMGG